MRVTEELTAVRLEPQMVQKHRYDPVFGRMLVRLTGQAWSSPTPISSINSIPLTLTPSFFTAPSFITPSTNERLMVSAKDAVRGNVSNRRKVLSMMAAAAGGGLAGCVGDDDDDVADDDDDGTTDPDELGERVETNVVDLWANSGDLTVQFENTIPILQDNLEELGVELEADPMDSGTSISNYVGGTFTNHWTLFPYSTTPDRLDPQFVLESHTADSAGAFPGGNQHQYANCEYTDLVHLSTEQPDFDTRHEMINDAKEVYSNDVPHVSLTPQPTFGMYRSDMIDADGLGVAGWSVVNVNPYIKSTPIEGDTIISAYDSRTFETSNYDLVGTAFMMNLWNNVMGSTLIAYNEENELENRLAQTIEFENDDRTAIVELEDATFHNGDPITAEDVQFSFEWRWENFGVFPLSEDIPWESVEIIDDQTVEFNMERPYAPLTTRTWPMAAVIHKESYVDAGALDNPEEAEPDPWIGSGPFQIDNFSRGDSIRLEPHDGHPQFEPDHNLTFQAFDDASAVYRAFEANEIQVAPQMAPGMIERAQDELGDAVEATQSQGPSVFGFWPTNVWGPGKFREYRLAVGKAVDRSLIVEQAFRGLNEPELHCRMLTDAHPFGTPTERCVQYTDDVTGDIEGAREILEDAGWGWDDEGNLHYPPDADLEPLWPDEGYPMDSEELDFPCLDENGWVHPDDR